MTDLNKQKAIQILQMIDSTLNGSHENVYSEKEAKVLLEEVVKLIEKDPDNASLLRKKLKYHSLYDLVVIPGMLAHSLRKSAGNKSVRNLIVFYLALADKKLLAKPTDYLKEYDAVVERFKKATSENPEDTANNMVDYLFYYWNHVINDVEIGLLRMTLTNSGEIPQWDKGTMQYFKRESHATPHLWKQDGDFRPVISSSKTMQLPTISLLTGIHGDKNFSLVKGAVFCNSFRVLIKDKPVDDRKIMMCSYSAAIADGAQPTSGIGILARIGDYYNQHNYPLSPNKLSPNPLELKEDNNILCITHKIPDEITNILFDRRDSLREIIMTPEDLRENKLFNSFSELPNHSHVEEIRNMAGVYLGYHLQNNHGKDGDKEEMGALRTFILEILPNGICHLLDDEKRHGKNIKPYLGFLSIKDLEKKKFLINMDREVGKLVEYHSWRLQFYIRSLKDGILEGIVSGFSKLRNNPITSPVRFKKANSFQTIAEFLATDKETNPVRAIFPSTFFKSEYHLLNEHIDLEKLLSWDPKAVKYFSNINDNFYFNSPNQSLPHNFININFEEYSRFKGLKGNYYLVSFSHAGDGRYLSKVRVQLRNYGEVFFLYPIELEETLEAFVGRWEMQENAQVLKIRLKYRQRGIKKVSDLKKLQPQSFGDFIFQLNSIEKIEKIDYLRCISVWVDKEKQNTLIAKREFLFPASKIDSDKDFPDDFVETYQYKFSLENFDSLSFFKGIKYFESDTSEVNDQKKNKFLEMIGQPSENIITVNNAKLF